MLSIAFKCRKSSQGRAVLAALEIRRAWAVRSLLIATLLLAVFGEEGLQAGSDESGQLVATINSGVLEINPASVPASLAPIGGVGITTGERQLDAVVFRIEDLNVLDLDGDGFGFLLLAEPEALFNPGAGPVSRRRLSIGTVLGFDDPSEPAFCVLQNIGGNRSTLEYSNGSGANLTVDYEIAYDIPAMAVEGVYSGSLSFTVSAL